jgi:hypothetical protein
VLRAVSLDTTGKAVSFCQNKKREVFELLFYDLLIKLALAVITLEDDWHWSAWWFKGLPQ